MDWLDLLAVQGTLKSLLQHHSSKASILLRSAFFIVQLSHPYMTTGKPIALTRQTCVGKVMSLLFNMLSRLVITFIPRSKCLLISWLQSSSAVILESIKSVTVSTVQGLRVKIVFWGFQTPLRALPRLQDPPASAPAFLEGHFLSDAEAFPLSVKVPDPGDCAAGAHQGLAAACL